MAFKRRSIEKNTPDRLEICQNKDLKSHHLSQDKDMWSKLGIGALFISILLLGYNVLIAIMRMGHTDQFIFVPTSLMKTFGMENFTWINNIPMGWGQKIALTIVNMPLSFLIFCLGISFFFIHMVTDNTS